MPELKEFVGGSTVYVSSTNAFGTARAVADAMARTGRPVFVVCPIRILTAAAVAFGGFPVLPLASERNAAQASRLQDEAAFWLSSLVPGANPDNVLLQLGKRARRKTPAHRLLASIRANWKRSMPLLPGPAANAAIAKGLSLLRLGTAFPTRHVVAISFPDHRAVLTDERLTVDTVLDSWDHPVRRSAGYLSRYVVAWNAELGHEWVRWQGAKEVLIGYPARLGYALRANPLRRGNEPGLRRLLLPVATSHNVPRWFEDEMVLFEDIVQAAHSAGWTVVIKPKPSTLAGELAHWKGRAGVELGSFSHSANPGSSLDYVLDDDVNRRRLEELASVDLVVSTVTTFGLDAAAAGVPVLQLALENAEAYPGIASAGRNAHLLRYLSSLPEAIRLGANRQANRDGMRASLDGWESTAMNTSKRLHDWLSRDLGGRREDECWDQAVSMMVAET